jgi:hypothetical protein
MVRERTDHQMSTTSRRGKRRTQSTMPCVSSNSKTPAPIRMKIVAASRLLSSSIMKYIRVQSSLSTALSTKTFTCSRSVWNSFAMLSKRTHNYRVQEKVLQVVARRYFRERSVSYPTHKWLIGLVSLIPHTSTGRICCPERRAPRDD